MQTLKNKTVFLFGTAGFGGGEEYFKRILDSTKKNLNESDNVIGSFMCQGKMPASVLKRYQTMLSDAPDSVQISTMIENFHSAALHPDQSDLELFKTVFMEIADNLS